MTTGNGALPQDIDEPAGAPASAIRFLRETGIAAAIAQAVEPVIEHMGFRLVRVTVSQREGQTVQIMAERPDGTITAGECEAISHELSPILDVLDPVAEAYRLEISSPGIDRPLVRPSDFEDWAGSEARIELREPLAGRKRFRGFLDGFADGEVRIEIDVPNADGKPEPQVIGLPVALVAEAKLVMTDELIRETLNRAKKLEKGGAVDGADVDDLPADVEVRGGGKAKQGARPKSQNAHPKSKSNTQPSSQKPGARDPRVGKPSRRGDR